MHRYCAVALSLSLSVLLFFSFQWLTICTIFTPFNYRTGFLRCKRKCMGKTKHWPQTQTTGQALLTVCQIWKKPKFVNTFIPLIRIKWQFMCIVRVDSLHALNPENWVEHIFRALVFVQLVRIFIHLLQYAIVHFMTNSLERCRSNGIHAWVVNRHKPRRITNAPINTQTNRSYFATIWFVSPFCHPFNWFQSVVNETMAPLHMIDG